jgi:hypothetical protein
MNSLSPPLSFYHHLKIYGYTNFLRRIPAGLLWTTAGRAYAYKGQNVSVRSSAIGSFLEVLLAIATGLPLAALAAFGLGFLSPGAFAVLFIIALALAIGTITPAVLARLLKLLKHQDLPAELTWGDTLPWAMIYSLGWLISGVSLFLIARLFTDVPMATLPMVLSIWFLSSLATYLTAFSPSGLGVRELSLTLLLGTLFPDPLPLLIALASRLLWTIYDLLFAGIAWRL